MSTEPTWQPLDWDSRFFGFGVGRLVAAPVSAADVNETCRRADGATVRLLYAACHPANEAARTALAQAGGVLVDMKRTYTIDFPAAGQDTTAAEPVSRLPAQPSACQRRQLRALAWQAAEYSRFKRDQRMPAGAWRRMYSLWIANSLNGQIADRVMSADHGDVVAGMVTVALRGPCASIGLLAVQHRQRGRGLGRRLVHAAFDQARDAGLRRLSVVTQGDNPSACRTYEACGMALAEEQCIFHLWTDR